MFYTKCVIIRGLTSWSLHVPFRPYYVAYSRLHFRSRERREAEARASRLQRRDDLAHVVADHAEAGVAGVLLNHCGTVKGKTISGQ
jgi:hypothetical protein